MPVRSLKTRAQSKLANLAADDYDDGDSEEGFSSEESEYDGSKS